MKNTQKLFSKIDRFVDNNSLWMIPLLFVLLFPPTRVLDVIPGIYKTLTRLGGVAVIDLLYLKLLIEEKRVSKLIFFYGVYWLYILAITVIKHNHLATALYGMGILSFGMLMFFEVFSRVDKKKFYLCLYYTIYAFIIINLISWIYYARSINIPFNYFEGYFLGNTNAWFNYYFPGIIIGYIYYTFDSKNRFFNIGYFLFWVIAFFTSFVNRSATTLIILLFLAIYILIFNRNIFKYIFNIVTYIVINICFFFFVVFPGTNNNPAASFISKFFGKTSTFSGRTPLWDKAKELIYPHILTGYGAYDSNVLKEQLNAGGLDHFHNMYFTQLYDGGIIGIILFFVLFAVVLLRIRKIKEYRVKGLLTAAIFAICLRGQVETNLHLLIILILGFLFYCESGTYEERNYLCFNKKK